MDCIANVSKTENSQNKNHNGHSASAKEIIDQIKNQKSTSKGFNMPMSNLPKATRDNIPHEPIDTNITSNNCDVDLVSQIKASNQISNKFDLQVSKNQQENQFFERNKIIRKQLVFLLHASKCIQREKENLENSVKCSDMKCKIMKNVLKHLGECKLKECQFPHCRSSKMIIFHWKRCNKTNCNICSPFGKRKQCSSGDIEISSEGTSPNVEAKENFDNATDMALETVNQIMLEQQHQEISSFNDLSGAEIESNDQLIQEQHQTKSVNKVDQMSETEIRNHVVFKVAKAILPLCNVSALKERGFHDLISFSKRIENYVYRMAKSELNYYNTIFVRIYMIKKFMEHLIQNLDQLPNENTNNVNSSESPPSRKKSLSSVGESSYDDIPSPDASSEKRNSMEQNVNSSEDIQMESSSSFGEVKLIESEPRESVQPNIVNKNCINFFTTELKHALLTVLDKLLEQEPESNYVNNSVKSQTDKKPMDLSTVRNKLICGLYQDPWEYIDDVWLIFGNASLYNGRKSLENQQCTELYEIFEQKIDSAMQIFGYCCGRKYKFKVQQLNCDGNENCKIQSNAKYYSYENYSKRYIFCKNCFKNEQIKMITIESGLGRLKIKKIEKNQFKKMINIDEKFEPFVECLECGRKQHQICVLYLEKIWPNGFVCDNCLKKKNLKRMENKFNANNLPRTKLGDFIETRVNNFLQEKEIKNKVHIRVVLCSNEIVKVKQGMHEYFVKTGKLPAEFPYRRKALFAFQEINGIDVCFFGMYVQEYNSECPLPNNRRVYISYLDSVKLFNPQKYRTDVYHEILLGYFDYVKNLGYTMAHIWSCPPSKGIDFIFNCHPSDQKIAKLSRLKKWYNNLFKKGVKQKTIYSFKTISDKYIIKNELSSVTQLPYFKNDYLSNEFETLIEILSEQNHNNRRQRKPKINTDFINTQKLKQNHQENKNESNEQQINENDLDKSILEIIGKTKEVIFMINLHSPQSSVNLGPIQDPDPLMSCDLMDNREAFVDLARDNNYEFSSLRRAKFSTLWMLYELYNFKLSFTCDNCYALVENPYHCTVCNDFDLCTDCREKIDHPHEMKILNLNLESDSLSPINGKETNSQKTR